MPAFVFTDIERSTQMWEQHPRAMARAMRRHDEIIYEAVEGCGGKVIEHTGDGVYAVFEEGNPLLAAIEIQRRFADQEWGEVGEVKVRVGVNATPPEREGIDFFKEDQAYRGLAVNEAARVTAIGWGGQILLTPAVLRLYGAPAGASIEDMGAHMLKSLTQPRQIYHLQHRDLPQQEFPPLRSLSVRPNNLPPQNTPFVGREKELAQVLEQLAQPDCRLLTVTGPGGVGKTRLAIQAAAEAIELFPDGVFFAPLATINDPDLIVVTIARAVNFSFYSGHNQKLQLLNYLHEKELLLVVDNVEHLLQGAHLIDDILEAAPRTKVIATCREWLNFPEERRLKLHGMDVPPMERTLSLQELASYSAIQLFTQVARRTQPDFALTRSNQDDIVRVCRLVGGMPLGIELSAAWVSAFSPDEIAAHIEQNLSFLSTSHPDVPDRHRSLYAVCDYFWSRLSPDEQKILGQLALFQGGFTTGAASEVAGASIFFLSALLDRAFLQKVGAADEDESGSNAKSGAWRYEMHEVLRQFATERMAEFAEERTAAMDRFAEYYSRFLEVREEALKGDRQEATLAAIRGDIDNVRSAWEWAVSRRDAEAVGRAFRCLHLVYDFLSWYAEGERLLAEAVEALRHEDDARRQLLVARLQARRATLLQHMGKHEHASKLVQQCLPIFQQRAEVEDIAFCTHLRGIIARITGRFKEAESLLLESGELYRSLERPWELSLVLQHLADTVYRLGRPEEARERMWECYVIRQKLGEPRSVATTLVGLGVYLDGLGEPKGARILLRGGLSKHRSIPNNEWNIATATLNLGVLHMGSGQYDEARRYFQRSLTIHRQLGSPWTISAALSNLGHVAWRQEKLDDARSYYREALQVAMRGNVAPLALDALVGAAHVAAEEGEPERALCLLNFALAHPQTDRAETAVQAQQLREKLLDQAALDAASDEVQAQEDATLENISREVLAYLKRE
ncbi:MAG TPA: tetratricopeptide repeat protein [Candidatus Sulfomarinibacteraceae bacterium]|nr:tetratricopeptide repeat protein [Candidatus Sulfomarinibacteraceae bacterium]